MALTDKKYANEHPKFNMFDKYKADKDSLTKNIKVADISGQDIARSKRVRGFKSYSLSDLKDLGIVNPTLTDDELDRLKKGKVKEPTGKFKE